VYGEYVLVLLCAVVSTVILIDMILEDIKDIRSKKGINRLTKIILHATI